MLLMMHGMVRSGSTLLYMLVTEYAKSVVDVRLEGFYSRQDLISLSHQLHRIIEDDLAHFIKTHSWPDEVRFPNAAPGSYVVFYTYRDLPEMAKSHLRMFGGSRESVLRVVAEQAAEAEAVRADGRAIMFSYEQLRKNPGECLRQSVVRLGWPLDEEKVQAAVDFAATQGERAKREKPTANRNKRIQALARMFRIGWLVRHTLGQRALREIRNRVLRFDSRTLLHGGHITSGNSGAMADEASMAELAETIARDFRRWREEFGYA